MQEPVGIAMVWRELSLRGKKVESEPGGFQLCTSSQWGMFCTARDFVKGISHWVGVEFRTCQDRFHHNTPSPFSSRCTMKPLITMLRDTCHHNAPWHLSSQYSRILFITMFHDHVITILHGPCHNNAPEFLSSQGSMTVSSQCSIILVWSSSFEWFFFQMLKLITLYLF